MITPCSACCRLRAKPEQRFHYRWEWTAFRGEFHIIPVKGGAPACIVDTFTGTIDELADMIMASMIFTRNTARSIYEKPFRLSHEPHPPIEIRRTFNV